MGAMLEKGNQDRVMVVVLAMRCSDMECLDIPYVRILKDGTVLKNQLSAFHMMVQIDFE